MAEALTTSWIVPVSRPPVPNGWVMVDQGRILAVGAGDPGLPVRDLGPGVLLPGLVNAHCHLELSHLATRLPGGRFVPWIESLVVSRGSATAEESREAVRAAVAGMTAGGTVAVGDISNELAHLDLLGPVDAVVFYELIGWDPARAGSVFSAALKRLGALPRNGVEVRLAAHAPHSVSRELFALLGSRMAAIHLAESESEVLFLRSGEGDWGRFLTGRGLTVAFNPPGKTPIAYLASLGMLHPGLLAAHCVQADREDVSLLRESSCSVVVCPRSNRFLGLGLPPVPSLLEAGVRVCVGTDSLASAPTLDVWDDVLALKEAFPEISWETLVGLATQGGADALGLHGLGSLEEGKKARFAFVPLPAPPPDPWSGLSRSRPRSLPA
jgi:cytosine/adenosine deaminase-related metal-dependent hydrolase